MMTRLLLRVRKVLAAGSDEIADLDAVIAGLDPAPSKDAVRMRAARANKKANAFANSSENSSLNSSPNPLPVTLPLTTTASFPDQTQDQEAITNLNSSFFPENAGACARSNLCSEDVSGAWHQHAKHYMLLHAHSSRRWRTAYETIAIAVNAAAAKLDRVPRETLDELMVWWWKSATGPIGSGRVTGVHATPEMLADKISTDLSRALGLLRDASGSGVTISPKVIALREARAAYEAAQQRGDQAESLRLEQQLERLGREFSHG